MRNQPVARGRDRKKNRKNYFLDSERGGRRQRTPPSVDAGDRYLFAPCLSVPACLHTIINYMEEHERTSFTLHGAAYQIMSDYVPTSTPELCADFDEESISVNTVSVGGHGASSVPTTTVLYWPFRTCGDECSRCNAATQKYARTYCLLVCGWFLF